MRNKTLSPAAASIYMGVCKHTVLKWLKDGDLKASKLPSGYFRIEPVELISFMKIHQMDVPEDLLGEIPSCIGDRLFGDVVRVIDRLPAHRRQRAYKSMLPYLHGLLEAV